MVAHIPAGAEIVAEPVEPEEWAREVAAGSSTARQPLSLAAVSGALPAHHPARRDRAGLHPRGRHRELRDDAASGADRLLRARGYCWVITGSTESGSARSPTARGAARDRLLPRARRTGRSRLPRLALRDARGGGEAVPFNFDWSFDYYPLAYSRPGPHDDDLPAARRTLRERLGTRPNCAPPAESRPDAGYPGLRCRAAPTPTSCTSRARSSSRATAWARSSRTRWSAR